MYHEFGAACACACSIFFVLDFILTTCTFGTCSCAYAWLYSPSILMNTHFFLFIHRYIPLLQGSARAVRKDTDVQSQVATAASHPPFRIHRLLLLDFFTSWQFGGNNIAPVSEIKTQRPGGGCGQF